MLMNMAFISATDLQYSTHIIQQDGVLSELAHTVSAMSVSAEAERQCVNESRPWTKNSRASISF